MPNVVLGSQGLKGNRPKSWGKVDLYKVAERQTLRVLNLLLLPMLDHTILACFLFLMDRA